MTLLRAIAAELRKTVTLPASLAAVAGAALGSLAITGLNAFGVREAIKNGQPDTVAYTSPAEAAFAAVPLGTVGAVILGVVAMSSEYSPNSSDAGGGRQVTTTLIATPRRLRLLTAKACSVTLLMFAIAAATIPACLAVAHLVVGDATASHDLPEVIARALGAALYWALTALIALAITALTRSGVIPLLVLVTNSSLVSVSLLLTNLTPLAYYLPDIAGTPLFARETFSAVDDALDPLTGGLVMTAWTLGLLGVAAASFTRRDA